jgi:hypothetical protein
MSDSSAIIDAMDNQEIGPKLKEALKNGLLIAYRVKNNSLDYSIMNRPEPNLSGIDDHTLATAILYAGNAFPIVVDETVGAGKGKTETVSRIDGRTVNYNEFIDIDWADAKIRTTRRSTLTLQVLQGIIGELVRNAQRPAAAAASRTPSN